MNPVTLSPQMELDRCQDTLLLLNDYYDAMDGMYVSLLCTMQ